jgi:hypothetical protein
LLREENEVFFPKMKFLFRKPRLGLLLVAMSGLAQNLLRAETPPADQVIQKAVARTQQSESSAVPDFSYRKLTMTEELDGAGNVKERREKVYEISYRDGLSHASLLQVNGHAPTDEDRKKQSDNESSFRQLLGQAKTMKADNRENFLTPDLVAHFDFAFVNQTNLNGRTAYQISFTPKNPEPPEHHLVDRVLNRVSGTLWIDADEFEVARAEVFLNSEVNLLGGVLGSLKKLAYTLERTRVADGIWLSTLSSGDFQGRKLLDSTHIKTKSESVNFKRVA